MDKPQIKFSHKYPKLWNQTEARLIFILVLDGRTLHEDLIDYDTKYFVEERDYGDSFYGWYKLPKTQLIQLVFMGNKGIPFCTLRRFTRQKMDYYLRKKGEVFDVVFPSTQAKY